MKHEKDSENNSENILPCFDFRQCACQLVWANEREVEPQFLRSNLQADSLAVGWLLLEGAAKISDENETVHVCPGQWFFPRAMTGSQEFQAGSRILSLRFGLRNRGGEELLPRDRHVKLQASQFPELELRAREVVARVQPWAPRRSLLLIRDHLPLDANLEIEAAFYCWLSAYARMRVRMGCRPFLQTIEDPRVRRALTLIEQHPMSQRFRVSDLARECGLGVNRLGALFHQATGQSPRTYYETLRLEQAQQLLLDTDTTIKEIAWSLGFHSLPHFSNWFKSRKGESPRAFQGATTS